MAHIDDIKYNFDSGARANRYHVEFQLPSIFGGGDAGRNMGLRVESCELPGREIETKEWSEYGQTRLLPTGKVTGLWSTLRSSTARWCPKSSIRSASKRTSPPT